ncbi:MAG TPA: IS4 family transposase, partial [Bacteroidales bacterium]|nr:IS4 family transposase [Bacteroidales bacterium]
IKNLYKQRWQIEVDFRNIKSTLGLKYFSCKTPKMVIKETISFYCIFNAIYTFYFCK